jgi:mono/diheme cytochrome c family protein
MNIKHGGSLTENQVGTLVSEMKREWGNPRPEIIPLEEETPTSTAAVSQGAKLFAQHCANCHGAEGRGGKAGALNDPAFLALVSPQGIRSLIITGRPDLTCDPKMPGYLDLVKVTPENAVSVGKEIDAICAYIQSWRKDRVSVTTPAPGTTEKPANQGTQP